MGFNVFLTVVYRGQYYYCYCRNVADHLKYCADIIDLIIKDYMLYKDYIKDMLAFLNIERKDDWIKWKTDIDSFHNLSFHISKHINIDDEKIVVVHGQGIKIIDDIVIKITNPKNQQFIDFINRRFLLKHICNKYNLPKDLHTYLVNFF